MATTVANAPVTTIPLGRAVLVLGIFGWIFGMVIFFMDIASFVNAPLGYEFLYTMGASGMWMGIFYFITGMMGVISGSPVRSGQAPTIKHCALVSALILSIFATIGAIGLAIAYGVLSGFAYSFDWGCSSGYSYYLSYCSVLTRRRQAVDYLAVYLSFHIFSFVVFLAQSIVTGISLGRLPSRTQMVYVQTVQQPYVAAGAGVYPVQYGVPQQFYQPPPQGQPQQYYQPAYPQGQLQYLQQQPPQYTPQVVAYPTAQQQVPQGTPLKV